MEEVLGYKVPKKVYLVKAVGTDQAFVVDAESKSQLETAKDWAIGYDRDYNRIEGEIIETDNEGFEAEFYQSANSSSQGGKLSFWNFKISKDGNTYIIGINQDLLLELINSCTIINGKIQEKVLFIKKKGNTGIVVKGSPLYNKCIDDLKLRSAKTNSKKTTNWKQGVFYESLTLSDCYLFDVYCWYKEVGQGWLSEIVRLNTPEKRKFVVPDCYLTGINKLSEAFIKEEIELTMISNLGYAGYLRETLPARVESNRSVEIDLSAKDLEEFKKRYIKYLEEDYTENQFHHWNSEIKQRLLLTTFDKNPPELTESDEKVLEKLRYF